MKIFLPLNTYLCKYLSGDMIAPHTGPETKIKYYFSRRTWYLFYAEINATDVRLCRGFFLSKKQTCHQEQHASSLNFKSARDYTTIHDTH